MLSKTTIVRKELALLESGKVKEAAAGLSDDFVFTGLAAKPMNKKQFLEFMQSLLTAFPRWKFNSSHLKEEGDTVTMKLYMMGTNNGEINIPSFGLNSVPATEKHVVLPAAPAEAIVKDELLSELTVTVAEGRGIEELIKQLGVEGTGGKH